MRADKVQYQPSDEVDFVIIGSGAAGGILAKELSTNGFRVVDTVSLGAVTARIRGVAFAPTTGRLFVTYAGKPQRPGFVMCFDLVHRKVIWREPAPGS